MFLKGHFKIAKISKLLPPTLKTLAGDSLKFNGGLKAGKFFLNLDHRCLDSKIEDIHTYV